MDLSRKILSDLICYTKYAKYLPEEGRRETWQELINRNKDMHIKKYPELKKSIDNAYQLVLNKEVIPSARTLQFAGKPIEISPSRGYNCAAIAIDHPDTFAEIMFLLLGGSGVGISVQKSHVAKLPAIKGVLKRKRRFLINDSIEGWADAVKVLMRAYFEGRCDPTFDFRDIRPKGAPLVTSGGKAPGPQPLKDCLHHIKKILDHKERGESLTPLECHDIVCHIAHTVLSGGIRRAAVLSLFSLDDQEMLYCKTGNWMELNPQRGRANNSVVLLRHRVKRKDFFKLWEIIKHSGNGEPGIFFSNDKEYLCNPCGEASLRTASFCNLTSINVSDVFTQEELNRRARAAAFIGTLQASYTDFHYLRDVWQISSERDSLIGVSLCGIANQEFLKLNLAEAAQAILDTNEQVAGLIGIKPAARSTLVKPDGTVSLLLGSSSGIHPWYDKYYKRRVRVLKNEAIYKYMKKRLPQLVEDEFFSPDTQAVITFPIKAPEGAITRHDETALDFLERIKRVNVEWIMEGHRSGANYHNTSATVHVRDNEWGKVGEWMWKNREFYSGLTVLPYETTTYPQMPLESCNEEEYKEMFSMVRDIDISKVSEEEDFTNPTQEWACSGDKCELVDL